MLYWTKYPPSVPLFSLQFYYLVYCLIFHAILRNTVDYAESLRQAKDSKAEADAMMSSMQSELVQKAASVARLERKNNLLIKEKDGLLKMISSYEADNEPSGQTQV